MIKRWLMKGWLCWEKKNWKWWWQSETGHEKLNLVLKTTVVGDENWHRRCKSQAKEKLRLVMKDWSCWWKTATTTDTTSSSFTPDFRLTCSHWITKQPSPTSSPVSSPFNHHYHITLTSTTLDFFLFSLLLFPSLLYYQWHHHHHHHHNTTIHDSIIFFISVPVIS